MTPERLQTLRTMPYDAYLQTPEWRRCRTRALRLAGWQCMRCPATRTLRVHHRTYERRGEELDGDLEVLCDACHEGHHINETLTAHPGVFVKLVSDALAAERFTSMVDLVEAVKVRAAQLEVPYDSEKIWKAAELVDANRHGVLDAPKSRPWDDVETDDNDRPITREEAERICQHLGVKIVPLRSMPAVERVSVRDLDRQRAMDIVTQEMLESLRRCEALEKALKDSEAK